MSALAASKPGSVFVADAFEQKGGSWWFIGDDFRSVTKREMVARYFGLGRVSLRANNPRPMGGLKGVPQSSPGTVTPGLGR
ncbi:MAG: hypothetical protein JWP01_3626 [Myxococcales bacterium]|nr:hypothetical protein [Myxococcales bacterium]